MDNLETEAPAIFNQHLPWLLGQPGLYISAILYLSAIAIWIWALRKVMFEKVKGLKYRFILAFYSMFLIMLVFYLFARFRYFSQIMGG